MSENGENVEIKQTLSEWNNELEKRCRIMFRIAGKEPTVEEFESCMLNAKALKDGKISYLDFIKKMVGLGIDPETVLTVFKRVREE